MHAIDLVHINTLSMENFAPCSCSLFLVHLSRRFMCTIVIRRCPSVVNFSHFRLHFLNHWTEFNETWQKARSQHPLPSLCFSGWSEKQDGRPGLWLAATFPTSPLKPLNGIQRNLTGSKISLSSTKFVFFRPIRKTRWPPWPLIGWDIFDFSSKTTEQNSTKLVRKQDLIVLYQVCIFRADRKNKMAALASDWLRHFRILLWNRWTEFNETWQKARSQCPLPSLCFSGWSEKQDGRPGLWLAETFSTSPLKPLNRIQRNLPGSKISTSSTKFVFFGPIGKLKWPPWPLIGLDIFDFPLKPLNRIQRNLSGSKISVSSTKFVFFRPIRKIIWLPWRLIGWDIFDFFAETAERNSMKLNRKQDLKVLYQVCVFQADRKKKMAALAFDWLRHFQLLLLNRWTEFNETWQKARSQCPLPSLCFQAEQKNKMAALASDWLRHFQLLLNRWTEFNGTWMEARSQSPLLSLCFSGQLEKQDGRPGLWLAETFSTSPLKPLNRIQQNLSGSKISTSSTKFVFFRADQKNKMAALASDWPRHFWLLLWNCWTEFNETLHKARSQCPLPSLCFSCRSEKQDGPPGWFLKKVPHCTQVHDMWPFGPLVIQYQQKNYKNEWKNVHKGMICKILKLYCVVTFKIYDRLAQRFAWGSQSSLEDGNLNTKVKHCQQVGDHYTIIQALSLWILHDLSWGILKVTVCDLF